MLFPCSVGTVIVSLSLIKEERRSDYYESSTVVELVLKCCVCYDGSNSPLSLIFRFI
jgi:hypothetical protein